jgi:hypothetical protein
MNNNLNKIETRLDLEYICTANTVSSLSTLHTITNGDELPINVLKPSDQRVFDGLLDLSVDETSGEWSEGFVQEIML